MPEPLISTVTFRLDTNDRNVGTVYLPVERAGPLPVLVLAHDWGADRGLYAFTAALRDRALAAGMAVVGFDFYGCGETGGEFRMMSYGRWAANLGDVCRFVEHQEWAARGRIGALGISSGATAVLRCAIDQYPLAFAVAVAPSIGDTIHMPDGPAKLLAEHLDALLAGGTVPLYGVEFGLSFFRDLLSGAPIYRLHKIACPVFFLQGAADKVFRRSDARLGYALMREHGLSAQHLEIEGGDHTLSRVPAAGAGAVLRWLGELGIVEGASG